MADQPFLVMAVFFGVWMLLLGWFGRRLPAYVLVQCFMALAMVLFILAAVRPQDGDDQLILVMALFAVYGLVVAPLVTSALKRKV